MATKLNYKIQVPQKEENDKDKGFSAKNRTKLSMQAVVNGALASNQPQAPAQPQIQMNRDGWGKNQ